MYCYKIKAAIKNNCPNYEKLKNQLDNILKDSKLIPLSENEYGTDDFNVGMGMISFLGEQLWFIDNAECLTWYNGEDYDTIHKYYEEDSLAFYLSVKPR